MNNMRIDLDPPKLLSAVHNNLNECFFKASKFDAKQQYRQLRNDNQIAFMTISSETMGDVTCKLALDYSMFDGSLTFNLFRRALAVHMRRTAAKLANKEDLNIFTSEETGDLIFNIPGIVEYGGKLNFLVTCIEQRSAGTATVRLVFLDPKLCPKPANRF